MPNRNRLPINLITSTRTYDALNRLTSEKDGKNQTISYAYDALGRKSAYTDAKGATFSFQFDPLGRLTRRTEPDATFQTYTYDAAGRLLVHRKADTATKTHVYGNANRDFLTQITYSNGESPRVMTYDRLGRLLSAANASSTITRSYDAAGRQLSETQALTSGPTGSFTYQYDADGNLSRHTRPDGSFIDYTYNLRNLLASVISDAPPPVATYTYNGRNQIASTVVENGLFTATRSYDSAGRLTGVSNGSLDTTGYTLSADGRRTGITRNGQSETYGYDNARQVTSSSIPDLSTTQSWNYDSAGNRSTATTNGSTTSYTANSVNEYLSINYPLSTPNPSYDPNGNTLSLPRPDGTALGLAWNINNELIAASNSTGDTATYAYDALGRRVSSLSTINSQPSTTYFFTNGWNVELEYKGTTYTTRLTWGLDLSGSLQGAGGVGGLVMVETLISQSPIPYFPLFDGNGNITAWIDASGSVIATQRYDAYGNLIQQIGTAPSNYGFSTKPQDQVTGFYYYGYRFYDALTGRWPSRDPIQERGGVNLYGFVGNNSNAAYDSLGLAITLYTNDVATLPMDNGMVPAGSAAVEDGSWSYSGSCSQTFWSYISTADNEELSLKGQLTIELTKDKSTDPNFVNPRHTTGWTVLRHEQHHAEIDKALFNVAAALANSYEGKYCRPCCSLAKNVAIAIIEYGEATANVANAEFDNFDYGKPIPAIRTTAMTKATKALEAAMSAYYASGCKKL